MKKAFTILELVIVISVLIILIGIAVPRMKGMQQAGTIAKVQGELQTFQAAIESYYANVSPNAYPGTPGSSSNNIGANFLVSATPQIISSPLYDPFNPTPSTEYLYYLSTNGQYYVVASMGPNDGWGCFVSGTKILLADGRTKNIENIQTGEVLLGPQQTHNKVIHLQILPKQDRKVFAFNGGRYFVTEDHPFMTTTGWKALNAGLAQKQHLELKIGRLQVNDKLLTINGLIRITRIEFRIFRNIAVYTLQLTSPHAYYANNFLVHNGLIFNSPTVNNSGIVTKKGDDICMTNGTGC